MMENILKNTQPQLIYTVMVASISLFTLASYFYLVKKPLNEYQKLQQARILLQAKTESNTELSTDIERLNDEVNQLSKHLHGESPIQPVKEIFADKMDRLDNISSHHKIQLLSVKPDSPKTIAMFKEISFDVEVAGRYLQLYKWLHEVERQFGSMVVKQFEIQPKVNSKKLLIRMKMASYRPSQEEK
jgi:Tfp pilus assembly protein PilO